MLSNFIYAKEKSLFEEALNNGEVLDEAIVFIEDTKEIWNHGTYFDGSTVDLSNIEASILELQNTSATKQELSEKVDKIDGKQLSTEDFTTLLKQKLEGLSNYDDTTISNAISGLQSQINTLVSGNASTAIDSFNEIIAFLNGIEDSQSLDSIIASIEQQIASKEEQYKGTICAIDTNDSVDDAELVYATKGEVAIANQKADDALKDAAIAKNAVSTLEGLADATTAMETLAGQVVQIEENKQKLSELDSKVGSVSIFNSRFEWTNQWIDDDGSGKQVAPYARAYFYNVRNLKKLHLSLSPVGGSKSYYHYVFFNAETPSSESIMADYSVKEGETASEYVGDVEVPEGAVLLGINIRTDLGYNNDVSIIDYGYILEQSVNNAEDIKRVRTDLSFLDYKDKIVWTNAWIGSDGEKKSINTGARAYFYKVDPGDTISMSLVAIKGPSDYYHYAFFNSEEPSASSLMAEYSHIREYNKPLNATVEVPEGAVLIGISVDTISENYISFKSGNKILELSKNVQNIKKNIALTEESVTILDAAMFEMFGMKDLDISDSLIWTNGVWHYEVNGGYGADFIKQTYRYSNKIDISGYDSVKLSGLMNGSSISASGSTVPTIIFFGNGEPIGWKMYQPGESFVVLTTDYNQYNKLEIILNAYQSEATYVPSIKVTKEGGLSKDVKDLKKESASVGETVSKLETSILGAADLDIANTLTWTNGVWHYTTNQPGGTSFMNQTYRYSNKIDISTYDEVKISGLWNGGPSSTSTSVYPTITYFGDGNPIGWRQYESGESFTIYRSDYKDYNKLEIVLNAFQSETTYVPSVKVTNIGGISEDVKTLKKDTESIGNDVSELKASVSGLKDVDIADTLSWTKGCWSFTNNSGPGSLFMQENYRYSRIDVSNYDSIKLSGLKNGGSMSNNENRWPTVSIYGDSNPIKYVDIIKGDSYILFTRDYKPYDKLEIIIMAYQSEETYVPSVIVNKSSGFEGEFIPKRIVVCGDSLSGNNSALLKKQLDNIAKAMGYEIILNAMGGENIIGNLTRNGGIGIRVIADFVMPESGSVDIEVESAWMKNDGTYAQNPYNNATNRDVRIMGIKGKLTRNSTTSYTFTRNEEGESFKVGIGTLLWDEALWSCKDYPHIWFTGQNMGYENEQDWADMINMAARNFGENFIVCSTALAGTTNQLVRCATKTFGDKYINLKAYTEGQAVYDGQRFGLIDSSASVSDYASLFWPGTDKVHQNNLLSYMWAVLMWNTLLDLGYVEGDRIVTGDYYKQ